MGIKLAEKFYSEENFITITDWRRERSSELDIKHRYYDIKNDDKRISKVLGSNRFDVVIYLSGNGQDFRSLSNILEACTNSDVKKFIVTSSPDIYDSQKEGPLSESLRLTPKTPKGMDELVKEYYCLKWGELNELKVLIVRYPILYGPKEELSESISPVFDIIKSSFSKEKIIIDNTMGPIKDYLYIDDFSEAVYMLAIDESIKGVFNVSSSEKHDIDDIIGIFQKNLRLKKPPKEEKYDGDGLVFDNKKITENIGWKPKTNISDGIEKTLSYYSGLMKGRKGFKRFLKEKAARPQKKRVHPVIAYIENIALFCFVSFLQYSQVLFSIKLFDLKIDYMVIYIIIMGILWGQTQAYISIVLSSIIYIAVNIFSGTDIVTFFYIPENLLRLAAYVLVGIVTGYAIDRKNREIEARDINISSLKDKYAFLLNVYNQTRVIKDELEDQIIDSEDSFGAVYSILQQLESLEIEKIFSSSIFALEKILKTDMVSIYTTSSNGTGEYMRLRARSVALEDKVPNSIKTSNFKELKEVFETKRTYVNRQLDKNLPVMMAPIIDRGKVIAIVSIHRVDFENLTMHYENLFQTVIGLITNTLKRAYIFEASLRDKRYIKDTRILTPDIFEEILEEIRKNKEELGMSYSLLKITNEESGLKTINEKIIGVIRDNDYIGRDKNDNLYVLLSNTKDNYAGIVIERLQKKGIYTVLVKDDINI